MERMRREIIIPVYVSKAARWAAIAFAVLVVVGLFLVIYIAFEEAKKPRWPSKHPVPVKPAQYEDRT